MWQSLADATSNITNAMTTALTVVLDRVGAVVQHIYLILVRQQIILGVQEVLIGLCWITLAIAAWHLIRFVNKKRSWADLDKAVIIAALGIVLLVSSITGLRGIIAALPRVANPEYYAIQDGVNLLKEVKNVK